MKIDNIRIEKIKAWNKHKQKNVKMQKLLKKNGNKWNKEREIQRKKIYKNEETKSRVKIRKNKTYNNEEKPCLKKNEVYLLFPNFKLASK
jgi:hypothetical protein